MRIVVNGHKDSLNNGNMLMVLGLIEGMSKRYPDATFYLLSDLPHIDKARYTSISRLKLVKRPWSSQRKGALTAILMACCYFLLIILGRVFEKLVFHRFSFPWNTLCQAYANADIAIDVSGDDMTTAYGWIAPTQVLFETTIAKLFGVKTVLLAQSIGPFNTWYMKIAAFAISHLVDYLTVRDEASYVHWKAAGSPQRCRDQSPSYPYSDLVHLVKMEGASYDRKGPVAVNISSYVISGLLAINGKRPKDMTSKEKLKKFGKLLAYIQTKTGCELLLLPHTFRPGLGDDRYWHKLLLRELAGQLRLKNIEEELTPYDVQKILQTCSFVIASRMHLALTAWRCGIPFLSFAYSHKYRQLTAAVPHHISPVISLDEIRSEEESFQAIHKQFNYVWEQRDEVRQSLKTTRLEAEALSSENIDLLAGIVDTQGAN